MSVTFFAMYIDMVFQRNNIRLNSSFWFYHNLYRIKWLYFLFYLPKSFNLHFPSY